MIERSAQLTLYNIGSLTNFFCSFLFKLQDSMLIYVKVISLHFFQVEFFAFFKCRNPMSRNMAGHFFQ